MRKIVFLFAVVLFPYLCHGQKKAKTYVGITLGIADVSGNFGKTDINDPESGFAIGGSFAEINTAYFIFKNLGIAFNAAVMGNGVEDSLFFKSLSEKYPSNEIDQYDREFNTPTRTNLLIGPEYSIPVGKFHFDFRAMTGIVFVYPGDFKFIYTEKEWGKKIRFEQEEANAKAIGYRGGIGIRMGGKNVAFRLSYDFMFTQPLIKAKRNYYDYESSYSNAAQTLKLTEEFTYRKSIANSMIGVGLVFQFNRK